MDFELETTPTSTLYSLEHNAVNDSDSADHHHDTHDTFQDLPDIFRRYDAFHYSIHGYLTLFTIFIGTIGNIINMVILTRKFMISSINIILTALAFADMMVLLTYLVKIKFHCNLQFMSYTEVTYSFAVFNLFVKNSFILAHTVSTWLTVVVAIWRVMDVCHPASTTCYRTPARSRLAIFYTALACSLVCVPEYLHYKVISIQDEDGHDKFVTGDSEIYLEHRSLFDDFDDWGFNIILYILPCVLLTGFTTALVRNIRQDKKKLEELDMLPSKYEISSKRLTLILVVILVVFLIVKIPPGVMYVLDFGLGYQIIHQVHFALAGTVNFLILLNSTINFFVYLAMSSRFRAVAYAILCKKIVDKIRSMRAKRDLQLESEIELSNC